PRAIAGLFDGAGERRAATRRLAGIADPQVFPLLVGESVAVILIEGASAICCDFSRGQIYAQLQPAVGLFAGGLDDGLHGNDGTGTDEERDFVDGWVQRDGIFGGMPFRGPIVEPFAWR